MLLICCQRVNALFFLTLLLFSCGRKQSCFQFADGRKIPQESIKNLSKNYQIDYRQYEGFVMFLNDSLFNYALLEIDSEINDVLSTSQIDNLKKSIIRNIKLFYKPGIDFNHSDIIKYIKKRFDFDAIKIEEDRSVKYYKNETLSAKLNFYKIGNPVYILEIYPTTNGCQLRWRIVF